jgi:hypothetical protein
MGFQTRVNDQPAPGEAGDFYGVNPRAVVLAGPGQFSAPANALGGLIVGNFCWADTVSGHVSQSYVPGWQIGMLHRENNAIIVAFLADHQYFVNAGLPVTLFSEGDFWALFAGGATPGERVYADPGTGAPIAAAIGGDVSASATASAGAALTASIGASGWNASASAGVVTIATHAGVTGIFSVGDTLVGTGVAAQTVITAQLTGPAGGAGTYSATVAGVPGTAAFALTTDESVGSNSNVLDATAVTGLISVGDSISGSGITTATVASQLSGTTGGIGQYVLNGAQQEHASESMTATSLVLDVTAIISGSLAAGDDISGSGVTSGTQITEQLSGAPGGIGTYQLSVAQEFASTTISVGAILTPWIVNSIAADGELATISTWG